MSFGPISRKRWIMAVSLPNDHKVVFYASPDLKRWDRVSEFGPAGATSGQWECPDLFELPVDGDPSKTRWVLKVGLNPGSLQGGSGRAILHRHASMAPASSTTIRRRLTLWSDYGKDCYCALTFNNLPASRSPVMLGWMNNWQYADKVPTHPWRGQMTIPRELSLQTFPEGIRLVQKPIAALNSLREIHSIASKNISAESFTLTATMDPRGAKKAGWKLFSANDAYTEIGYDSVRKEVFVDRTHTGKPLSARTFPPALLRLSQLRRPAHFRILVDRDSIEVFTAGGRIAITNLIFTPPTIRISFFSEGGTPAKLLSAESWSLRSIW